MTKTHNNFPWLKRDEITSALSYVLEIASVEREACQHLSPDGGHTDKGNTTQYLHWGQGGRVAYGVYYPGFNIRRPKGEK